MERNTEKDRTKKQQRTDDQTLIMDDIEDGRNDARIQTLEPCNEYAHQL